MALSFLRKGSGFLKTSSGRNVARWHGAARATPHAGAGNAPKRAPAKKRARARTGAALPRGRYSDRPHPIQVENRQRLPAQTFYNLGASDRWTPEWHRMKRWDNERVMYARWKSGKRGFNRWNRRSRHRTRVRNTFYRSYFSYPRRTKL